MHQQTLMRRHGHGHGHGHRAGDTFTVINPPDGDYRVLCLECGAEFTATLADDEEIACPSCDNRMSEPARRRHRERAPSVNGLRRARPRSRR